jgi:hypothetical protein
MPLDMKIPSTNRAYIRWIGLCLAAGSWAAFFCREVDLEMGPNTKHEQVGGSADASKTQKHRQVGGC